MHNCKLKKLCIKLEKNWNYSNLNILSDEPTMKMLREKVFWKKNTFSKKI